MIRAAMLLCCAVLSGMASAQSTAADTSRLTWFRDAKLGIFIHWGIYSVDGTDESWAFFNKKLPYAEYMKQLDGFRARRYEPDEWADLIKKSGARYAVFTMKHHDGVAMYETQLPLPELGSRESMSIDGHKVPLSTLNAAPARRDMALPLFTELRERGLKCGAYYSLIDWTYQHYPAFTKDSTRYTIKDDSARWQHFRKFFQGQIEEITEQLDPDLWWFDGDWEHSAEEWEAAKVRAMILEKNPQAIINGRLQGFGDYATPEQNIPIGAPKEPAWELCMTLGEQWGWQPQDSNYKSTHDLIHIFADVIGHGGNLLLGIGPKEDGTFTSGQVARLEDLGKWTSKHAEAIYGTRAGLPNGHFFGPSTLSQDSTTLYLFLANGARGVEIKGLDNRILAAEVVGADVRLDPRVVGKISWSKVPGLVFVDVPEAATDKWMTVVKLKLDGPVRLYRGQGGY